METNKENIYRMLHDFRNWNREWDLYMAHHPDSADEFVEILHKKYTVHSKELHPLSNQTKETYTS